MEEMGVSILLFSPEEGQITGPPESTCETSFFFHLIVDIPLVPQVPSTHSALSSLILASVFYCFYVNTG